MKKGEVEKEITSASKAQILFLKGPQEGLPAPALSKGLERPGPNSNQPKLVWLYKQDLETFLCYKRASNKHTQVSSWGFFFPYCCF